MYKRLKLRSFLDHNPSVADKNLPFEVAQVWDTTTVMDGPKSPCSAPMLMQVHGSINVFVFLV